MDSIDEALLFLLLTVTFGERRSVESDYLRANLVVQILDEGLGRSGSYYDELRESGFEKRYAEFLSRLDHGFERFRSFGWSLDSGIQHRFFDSLGSSESLSDSRSLARAIQDLIDSSGFGEFRKETRQDRGVERFRDNALDFLASAPRAVQAPVEQPVSLGTVSALFADPHQFAVDPVIGAVSFEELKRIYERETGV